MANYTYKRTTTDTVKVRGEYDHKKQQITVTEKDGSETTLLIENLLAPFDGNEIVFGVSDKEEVDLLES